MVVSREALNADIPYVLKHFTLMWFILKSAESHGGIIKALVDVKIMMNFSDQQIVKNSDDIDAVNIPWIVWP